MGQPRLVVGARTIAGDGRYHLRYPDGNAPLNPIGANLSAGGTGSFSYEGFAIFKNRVREGRGFTVIGNTTVSVPLSATGWPTTDWVCPLWEGQIYPSWGTGVFKCGFTLVNAGDTPTVAGNGSGASVANVVQTGATVTFDLTMTLGGGFQVSGTTAGATNIFAYLPAYPGSSIDDPTSSAAFTNEIIADAKKNWRMLRVMDAISTISNTLVQSAATRHTPANTQARTGSTTPGWYMVPTLTSMPGIGATSTSFTANWTGPTGQYGLGMPSAGGTCGRIVTLTKGQPTVTWDAGQPLTEAVTGTYTAPVGWDGFPIEWFIALCKAAGIGLWLCCPLFEDGTNYAAGSYTAAVMDALNSMGFTGEVVFETASDEVWNYHAGTLQGIIQYLGYTTAQVTQYMGYRAHALGVLGRSKFGSAWGARVKQAFCWQTGGTGLSFFYTALSYMNATYGAPSADVGYVGVAPYCTPTIANTDTIAQIQNYVLLGQGTAGSDGPRQALRMSCENIAIVAMSYGIAAATYEDGGQWNAVNQSAVNVGAALMDNGMTAAIEAYETGLLNSPFSLLMHFTQGVAATASNASPVNELSNNYAQYIASGSPVLTALQSLTAGGLVPTRNALINVGDAIDCINYADNTSAISATYRYFGELSGYTLGPHYGTSGYQPYTFWRPAAGVIGLTLTVNSTAAGATDIEVNGTVVASNVAIPNFSGQGVVDLGQVTAKAGWNYLCLGRANVTQAGVTPKAITLTSGAIAAAAADTSAATGALSTGIKLAGAASDPTSATAALTTSSGARTNFDYYVSPTGSDANAGTLASPWAITAINTKQATYAGKRLGLLPGTYDVSGLMGTNEAVAALTIAGGSGPSNQTYIAASDASGNYAPRTSSATAATVTLDAMGSTGFYGGNNANTSPVIAGRAGANYWTVDGLKFTGYSMWCFHVGNSPSGGACPTNWTIQNCEFTGGNASFASNATFANGVNCGVIIVYGSVTGTITENWFHDNTWNSRDPQHWSCMYHWGLGDTPTVGTLFSLNTIERSGNLQGKELTQYNTEIAYNWIDMTGVQSGTDDTACPIYGFMSDNGNAAATGTKWHHNVIRANAFAFDFDNTNGGNAYLNSPLYVYNNTIVTVGDQADGFVGGGYDTNGAGQGSAGHLYAYNNLYYDNGHAAPGYGYWLTNVDSFALCDYNIYGTWNKFLTVPAGHYGSAGATTYGSLAAWASAIGGREAHSSTSAVNPFTNNGTYAKQYQVQGGSPAFGTGRVGGVSTGAVANVGAWDGSVTQIGATWVN